MTLDTAVPSALDAVRELTPQMRAALDDMDRERRLPASLADAMLEAGLFHVWVPAAFGGAEAEPASLVRAIEAAAAIDGSIGWNLMISGVFGVFGGCLPEGAAREIYGPDPRVITAGTFRPNGKAIPVDGGYRISGRWPLASNCQNASWFVGGALIMDGDKPRVSESGAAAFREFFIPAGDCLIADTWQSAGLRGTGSHDFTVADVFVPAARSLSFSEPAVEPGPLYALPLIALFATAISAVSLGIARHAISMLQVLAGAKKPTWSQNLLRERSSVQWQVGQAEALVRAGRAFMYEALDDAWRTVCTGRWSSAPCCGSRRPRLPRWRPRRSI
jgi:alkylation response protein AidB-like acyl-CoA dehydrogenase